MLSFVDLLEANTLSREMAAYFLALISQGNSFMVGANPGGAGKTTVMCALLNFLPPETKIIPTEGERYEGQDLSQRCFLCHEIGSGSYYAYLWGEALRDYVRLLDAGAILATNLHADTLEEAKSQICGTNQVEEDYFSRINLKIFLKVEGTSFNLSRKIAAVYESSAELKSQLVWEWNEKEADFKQSRESSLLKNSSPEHLKKCQELVDIILNQKVRTIEEVRGAILDIPKRSEEYFAV